MCFKIMSGKKSAKIPEKPELREMKSMTWRVQGITTNPHLRLWNRPPICTYCRAEFVNKHITGPLSLHPAFSRLFSTGSRTNWIKLLLLSLLSARIGHLTLLFSLYFHSYHLKIAIINTELQWNYLLFWQLF